MADAACIVLTKDSRTTSGNFFIDEEILVQNGVKDLSVYSVDPNSSLITDFFVEETKPNSRI